MTLNLEASHHGHKIRTIKYVVAICLSLSVLLFMSVVILLSPAKADSINTTDFVTTWKTDNEGESNDTSITIPTEGDGYNYSVDWNNDGVFDQIGITGNVTHNFGIPGEYTIRIQGDFPRISFINGGDRKKIININQWGTNAWTTMSSAFYGASNLTSSAVDTPNLTNVTNMSSMFIEANAFNGDLSSWDTSSVTNMSYMFIEANAFNGDLSSWDTSSVTNMSYMFYNATAFNQSLASWDMTSVLSVDRMLAYTNLSVANYDATLIGWASQLLRPGLTLGATTLIYDTASVNRQYIIDNYGWTIVDDHNIDDVQPKIITSVDFSVVDDKNILTIAGTGLVGELDPSEYYNAESRSLVSVNSTALPMCMSQSMYDEYQGYSNSIMELYSTNAPCYYSYNDDYEPIISTTEVKVWLPSAFDTTAPGTVSVNGSNTYLFNAVTDPAEPETPTTISATAYSNGTKPLDQTPVLPKRPTFSGIATPGAAVVVTVRSDPVSCSATADSIGNWSCTLPSDLVPGAHTAYIQVTNPDGSIQNLGPYAITVAGQTISSTTPLAPNTGFMQTFQGYKQVQASNEPQALVVMIIALSTSFIISFAAVLVVRSRRRAVQFERM